MVFIKSRIFSHSGMTSPIQTGFTLIEILVVLVIVGVITGVALLSAPAFLNYVDFNGESKRVRVLLEMLRDESVIEGLEFGFYPMEHSYSFYSFDEDARIWREIDQGSFKSYQLPESISLKLKMEKQVRSRAASDNANPPVFIFSSGDMTPFELEIKKSESLESRVLISDGYADLAWKEVED